MNLKIQMEVECPTVPNFIRTANGESVSIGEFTDYQLRTIGEYWITQLLKAAQKRRKDSRPIGQNSEQEEAK